MFNFLKQKEDGTFVDFCIDYAASKKQFTDLAIEIGVNKIADTIAMNGFKVISNAPEKKSIEYLLNVRPNVNQSSVDFWRQAIKRMLINPEGCLIVNTDNNGMFIADNWDVSDSVQTRKIYSNIELIVDDNTMKIKKKYRADEVLHLQYTNPKLLELIRSSNETIETAWSVALNGFKARRGKLLVEMPNTPRIQQADGTTITSNEYVEKLASKISSEDFKAVLTNSNVKITNYEGTSGMTSNDLTSLKNDIFNNVAIAINIPKTVFFGEVTEKSDANNEFITYACKPVMKIIENEMNATYIEREDYDKGERILIKKNAIKHIDVIESAGSLDKLYQNGWNHNDILELLDEPTLSEGWANERRFTKNYSTEGGE